MLFPPPPTPTAPHRVVVTGAGIASALGLGWAANAQGFREGRVALRPVTRFDVSRQRTTLGGEVELPANAGIADGPTRRVARLDRATLLLRLALGEAWRQCGWAPSEPLPVVLGTTSAGMPQGEAYFRQATTRPSPRGQATRILHYMAQVQTHAVLNCLGLTGAVTLISNACASGANAIGHAWDMVRHGQAPRVLTGGYEGLCHLVFAGFDSLQALSPTPCRPFDAQRDGLTLGEGAAIFALETLPHATARGATILGEIVGYGTSTDTHHMTQPQPEGVAVLTSMRAACATGRLQPDQIGYINAHGTGTALNDSAEAAAINAWAGPQAAHIPVSSTKSSVGHLLGAAGAIEAAVCLMALHGQWLPPTPTTREPDPVCRFPLVREPTRTCFEYALSNSIGFGGSNATLVFRRWS